MGFDRCRALFDSRCCIGRLIDEIRCDGANRQVVNLTLTFLGPDKSAWGQESAITPFGYTRTLARLSV
jgi:hypothetical protein